MPLSLVQWAALTMGFENILIHVHLKIPCRKEVKRATGQELPLTLIKPVK